VTSCFQNLLAITIFCRNKILAGNKDYVSIWRTYPCNVFSFRVLCCDNLEIKRRDASKIQNEQRHKNYTELYGFWPVHKVDCINEKIKGLYWFFDLKCSRSCTYTVSVASSVLIRCVISRFRRKVDENWFLLCYYTASIGNFLPTFRDNLWLCCSGINKFN